MYNILFIAGFLGVVFGVPSIILKPKQFWRNCCGTFQWCGIPLSTFSPVIDAAKSNPYFSLNGFTFDNHNILNDGNTTHCHRS
jgi:hypothetical protein